QLTACAAMRRFLKTRTDFLFSLHRLFPNIRPMNRAVFLDRDGTLIVEKNYLSKPEDVVIFPGAAVALKKLQDAGFRLFIVSNQSGVGRGYFTLADVENVHRHLAREFARDGVRFEKIYVA